MGLQQDVRWKIWILRKQTVECVSHLDQNPLGQAVGGDHRSRILDPLKHCLNPLKDISYKRARDIADIVYTAYPH
jgi:hypothetical protein